MYLEYRGAQITAWVKHLNESYFLNQPIIQLPVWVHEMVNYFLGPECGKVKK